MEKHSSALLSHYAVTTVGCRPSLLGCRTANCNCECCCRCCVRCANLCCAVLGCALFYKITRTRKPSSSCFRDAADPCAPNVNSGAWTSMIATENAEWWDGFRYSYMQSKGMRSGLTLGSQRGGARVGNCNKWAAGDARRLTPALLPDRLVVIFDSLSEARLSWPYSTTQLKSITTTAQISTKIVACTESNLASHLSLCIALPSQGSKAGIHMLLA